MKAMKENNSTQGADDDAIISMEIHTSMSGT
jgi:hypothetical protein